MNIWQYYSVYTGQIQGLTGLQGHEHVNEMDRFLYLYLFPCIFFVQLKNEKGLKNLLIHLNVQNFTAIEH